MENSLTITFAKVLSPRDLGVAVSGMDADGQAEFFSSYFYRMWRQSYSKIFAEISEELTPRQRRMLKTFAETEE